MLVAIAEVEEVRKAAASVPAVESAIIRNLACNLLKFRLENDPLDVCCSSSFYPLSFITIFVGEKSDSARGVKRM